MDHNALWLCGLHRWEKVTVSRQQYSIGYLMFCSQKHQVNAKQNVYPLLLKYSLPIV